MRYTTLLQLDLTSSPEFQRNNFSRLACVLSPDGQYDSQASCTSQTQCGWKYKCVNQSCVLAPDGTFETQNSCFATCSRWACQVPLTITSEPGTVPYKIYSNGFTCANKFPCATVTYYPLLTFVAYKPFAQIKMGSGNLHIDGGTGDDYTAARFVLLQFGNQQAGVPDQSSKPEIKELAGENVELNIIVAKAGTWRQISGRGSESVAGLDEQKVQLQLGYQYQLCYQLISKSDDNTEVSWPAAQVILTDS